MTAFVTLSFGPSHMSVQDMKIFNQMLSKVVRQTEYEAQGDPAISEIKGGPSMPLKVRQYVIKSTFGFVRPSR